MWWQYLLVFLGTMLVDIVPLPLPPAFTVMVFLQIKFDLNVCAVIVIGVIGSLVGRYILASYIPHVSAKIFKQDKNDDARMLGTKMKANKRKAQMFVLTYSLMPLPTTPLFIAGGMARMKPMQIIPPFVIGKLISDTIAVLSGKFAAENTSSLLEGVVSFKSIAGLVAGLLLVAAILFIDWRTVFLKKKLKLKFNIWK
jgi:membrane protein DedA with SNARE-associated domain